MTNKKRLIIAVYFVLIAICFFGISYSFFAAPTAEITLRTVTRVEIDDDDTLTLATGLPNVGVGVKVYLLANEDDASITSYSWTLSDQPTGSSAALSSTTAQNPTLLPDVEGQYKVTLTVTSSGGTSSPVDLWISAGTWNGTGTISTTKTGGYCSVGCHYNKIPEWQETAHATMLERNMDHGAAYYGASCIECHTVGYNTETTADNEGFDDIMDDLGWTFPSPPAAGNWDSFVENYPTLANLGNIQCENCHGPGSQHNSDGFGKTDKNQMVATFESGACESCHAAETHHIFPQQWANSAHAGEPARTTGSCAPCHTGSGFAVEHDDDYDSVPTGIATKINCVACHDPHNADNEYQLRQLDDVELGNSSIISSGGLGKACMDCHKSRRDAEDYAVTSSSSHYGPHYGTQTDMLFGTNAVEFGLPMGMSPHYKVVENTCVTCHMVTYEDDASEAMGGVTVTDELEKTLRDNAFGHSFFNAYTDPVTSVKYENIKACTECHGDIESFDEIMAMEDYDGDGTIEGVTEEVAGMLHTLALLLPPYNEDEVSEDTDDFMNLAERKAVYNYYFVEDDGSHGIHNAAYTIGLLKASFAALGVEDIAAGKITSVTDVPNDQGKQVRVSWLKFPGDGPMDPKIVKYGVWRKVDTATMGKVADDKIIEVADYDEMYSKIDVAEGMLFKVAETETWDFTEEVPAAELESYSTIAATIYDSTIVNGMHMSYFKISGHGSNNSIAMSVADSGYSVDNLAPYAPASLSASISQAQVSLTWAEPEDTDFDYFAVYRSESSNFTPGSNNKVGTTASNAYDDKDAAGNLGRYYYKISAFDFSGNESGYSAEVSALVTSVENDRLMPTEFGLKQNFPNPFNPSTVIEYQLPAAAQVRLTIYNILGQEVRTLVDRFESTGYRRVIWDARDNHGRAVSPGVYIYKLQAGNFVSIKKMVLLK
ncbi:T9SS type A sorting domain-containing protein [candidate division KSB1 bacterium]